NLPSAHAWLRSFYRTQCHLQPRGKSNRLSMSCEWAARVEGRGTRFRCVFPNPESPGMDTPALGAVRVGPRGRVPLPDVRAIGDGAGRTLRLVCGWRGAKTICR